ncbi:MAG: hypothetical protein R3Y67_09130 [Eubacteriales bacterium]
MDVTKNEHAKLFIRGIAMNDDELGDITKQLLSPTLGTNFTLYGYEEEVKTPIFKTLSLVQEILFKRIRQRE